MFASLARCAMSYMFEVYYPPPADPAKEEAVTKRVAALGGRLDFREDAGDPGRCGICLTYDFDSFDAAAKAANLLRQSGEHVEGPVEYGA
jgi:hypothetical protein